MREYDQNILNEDNISYQNMPSKRKKITNIILYIIIPILLISIIVVVVICFKICKKTNENEEGYKDNPYELDNISREELDRARHSLKQYIFFDLTTL